MNVRIFSSATRLVRSVSKFSGLHPSIRPIQVATVSSSRSYLAVSTQEPHKRNPHIYLSGISFVIASSVAVVAHADAATSPPSASILNDEPVGLSVLTKTENATGVQFPITFNDAGTLHGTGVRLMGGLVRVYALGLYADRSALRDALSNWKGFSREEILSSDALWDSVCDVKASFTRTFRFVVVREVGGKHMRTGFERGLAPRVAKAVKKGRCKPSECKRATKKFADMFLGVGTMKVGSEAVVVLDGDKVSLTIDGRLMGEVRNPQLSWAMADMFLGGNAVAPTLRVSAAETLEELLRE